MPSTSKKTSSGNKLTGCLVLGLKWLFVYPLLLSFALFGLALYGIPAGILGIVAALFSPAFPAWLASQRGYVARLSRLPLMTLESPQSLAIAIGVWILPLSIFSLAASWGAFSSPGGSFTLFLMGTLSAFVMYGWLVAGWRTPKPEDEQQPLAFPWVDIASSITGNGIAIGASIVAVIAPLVILVALPHAAPDLTMVTPTAAAVAAATEPADAARSISVDVATEGTQAASPSPVAASATHTVAASATVQPTEAPQPTETPTEAQRAATVPVVVAEEPSATATEAPPTDTPEPSATPTVRVYAVAWVSDVTVADDTVMQPGQAFVKTWRVQNAGNCVWPDDAELRHTTGPSLSDQQSVAIEPAEPEGEVEVSVPMVAPSAPGVYESVWSVCAADECADGYVITRIIVPTPVQAAPVVNTCAFVGNSNSHKYHRAGCRHIKSMNPENRVCFSTREEALAAGYSPCGTCGG